jgi:crossover junction endodeoxyribonuclease RusA
MTLSGYNIQKAQTTQALRDAVKTQTVSLPWPPKELKPNARPHWAAKAKAAKKYKNYCDMECWKLYHNRRNLIYKYGIQDAIQLSIVFYPPSKRHFDLDNALASVKHGIDAISAAIGIDDRHFSYQISRGSPVKHGRVDVTIEVAA